MKPKLYGMSLLVLPDNPNHPTHSTQRTPFIILRRTRSTTPAKRKRWILTWQGHSTIRSTPINKTTSYRGTCKSKSRGLFKMYKTNTLGLEVLKTSFIQTIASPSPHLLPLPKKPTEAAQMLQVLRFVIQPLTLTQVPQSIIQDKKGVRCKRFKIIQIRNPSNRKLLGTWWNMPIVSSIQIKHNFRYKPLIGITMFTLAQDQPRFQKTKKWVVLLSPRNQPSLKPCFKHRVKLKDSMTFIWDCPSSNSYKRSSLWSVLTTITLSWCT